MKLILRIFVFRGTVRTQHSFLVANDQGGLTSGVGAVAVNSGVDTLTELRSIIEVQKDKAMCRRSVLFEEVLYVLSTAPNPHAYPANIYATSYQFGILRKRPDRADDGKHTKDGEVSIKAQEEILMVPEVIPLERESELTVGEVIPPLGPGELPTLILIPGA